MIMTVGDIREELFRLQDVEYGGFVAKLIPTMERDRFIGVRTPVLRKLAKELAKQGEQEHRGTSHSGSKRTGTVKGDGEQDFVQQFMTQLPHEYFDENQLHALMICEIKDLEKCLKETDRFLPFVDNWATCDQMSPKVFREHRPELLPKIREWMSSEEPYIVRFGIGMLMTHFLDEEFRPGYLEMVAEVESTEYYVNMMRAWYFATALAKQYEAALPYIEEQCLDLWTHNKTIQKSVESFRITDEQKNHLKTLRRK